MCAYVSALCSIKAQVEGGFDDGIDTAGIGVEYNLLNPEEGFILVDISASS